ncbi:MAG: transposase [Methylomicrobium sp.]
MCTAETLRRWVSQNKKNQGKRSGTPSADQDRLKELEHENRELKRANTHGAQVIYCAKPRLLSPRRNRGPPTEVMAAFIDAQQIAHEVESVCPQLPIAPSTYYEYKVRELVVKP